MKKTKTLLYKILTMIFLFIIILYTNSFATTEPTKDNTELEILSNAVILIDSDTGTVLYSKNATQKVYPASTTKILTAILALENTEDLSDITTASYSAISLIPAGYSSAYLSEGEEITIHQLLEVLLIHSANDAANVLAEYVSGSVDNFVNLMNEKATELGCTNTHFVNTNGIHDEKHYTTAYDLALIMQYCLKNETFREIISMKSCTIPATNKSEERTYKNTNDLIIPSSSYYYEGCIGGKTGYTSQAQNCLISACSKDGLELIAVVLGALPAGIRYVDSTTLYDYGYSTYSVSTIASKSDVIDTIEIPKANSETKNLDLLLEDDVYALVNVNQSDEISYEITLNDDLQAPIAANSVVGTVTYTVGDLTYTENLLAANDVEKSDIVIWVLRGLLTLILLIIIYFVIFKFLKKRKRF